MSYPCVYNLIDRELALEQYLVEMNLFEEGSFELYEEDRDLHLFTVVVGGYTEQRGGISVDHGASEVVRGVYRVLTPAESVDVDRKGSMVLLEPTKALFIYSDEEE